MTAALLFMFLGPLSLRAAAPPGRLENVRLGDAAGGSALTTFPSATRVVYLNFDYREMDDHQLLIRLLDAAGNELFTVSRTLSGAGSAVVPLDSVIAVDRLYDALDRSATDLILAIDGALTHINDRPERYRHIQEALVHVNRMRAAVGALRGLPLPADAATELDRVADRLEGARSEGLVALSLTEMAAVLPHLQAMRAESIDLIVSLRAARAKSGTSAYPFPPSVDCQPYLVNMSINGLLRESLEFAIGDPGRVADLRLAAGRPVIFPGLVGQDATTIRATLLDARCQPVSDGTLVTFHVEPAALAATAPVTATTSHGTATTILRALGTGRGNVRVTAEAGSARATVTVHLAGSLGAVVLTTSEHQLGAGQGVALTAIVTDASGQRAQDGTLVSFAVAPPDRGRVSPTIVPTTKGRATTLFTAGPAVGPVVVSATSGGARGEVSLTVGPAAGSTAAPPFPTSQPPPGNPPPLPPTPVLGAARPECPGRSHDVMCYASAVIRVYRDDTCNRRFDPAWDRWLAGVPVTLVFPSGYVETKTTSSGGSVQFGALTIRRGETMRVFAALSPGSTLCYNSYSEFKLDIADFEPAGHVGASFRTH